MARTMDMHRDFHRSLLSNEAELDRIVNLEPVLEHSTYRPTLDQQTLIELRANVELPKLCDSKDVVITVLKGRGSLALNQDLVTLQPEVVVFIPSCTPHTLRTQTDLIFLLSPDEPDLTASESVWVINL